MQLPRVAPAILGDLSDNERTQDRVSLSQVPYYAPGKKSDQMKTQVLEGSSSVMGAGEWWIKEDIRKKTHVYIRTHIHIFVYASESLCMFSILNDFKSWVEEHGWKEYEEARLCREVLDTVCLHLPGHLCDTASDCPLTSQHIEQVKAGQTVESRVRVQDPA